MDDPLVRRVIRIGIVICLAAGALAWLLAGSRMAFGVLGGGLLIAISLYTLSGGVAAVVRSASGRGGRPGQTMAKVAFRYALLGFLAYVMIARLRLHPIGLLVGATSITAAVFVEAVRHHAKRS